MHLVSAVGSCGKRRKRRRTYVPLVVIISLLGAS